MSQSVILKNWSRLNSAVRKKIENVRSVGLTGRDVLRHVRKLPLPAWIARSGKFKYKRFLTDEEKRLVAVL